MFFRNPASRAERNDLDREDQLLESKLSMTSSIFRQPIRQIAYVVEDVREAAARHSALYGSGPFLVGKLPSLSGTYRGKEHVVEMTAALGQWGAMQVEFLQQDSSGPSVLREPNLQGSKKLELHHLACIVDDIESAVAGFEKAGYAVASRLSTGAADIAFIDMLAEEGCFIELASAKAITPVFDLVAQVAVGFDGQNTVREWDFNPPS